MSDAAAKPEPRPTQAVQARQGALAASLHFAYDAAGVLAALCLAAIALIMLAQALSRYFGWGLVGGDDLAAWSCAASAFLGLAHTHRHGELIRMEIVLDLLPPQIRHGAELFALTSTSAAIGYAAVATCAFVYANARDHEVSQGLIAIPIWIPQASAALGLVLLFLAFAEDLVRVARRNKPAFTIAQEARRAAKDFSESL